MRINSKYVDPKCALDICYRIVISIYTSILCSLYIKWKLKSIINFLGKKFIIPKLLLVLELVGS
jgi:hypothetical protein